MGREQETEQEVIDILEGRMGYERALLDLLGTIAVEIAHLSDVVASSLEIRK